MIVILNQTPVQDCTGSAAELNASSLRGTLRHWPLKNVRIEKKSQELAAETLELKEISGTGTVLATEMLELKLISGIGH